MSREKQIEEMTKVIASVPPIAFPFGSRKQGKHIYILNKFAEALYNADFRKQREGEWIVTNNNGLWYYDCPFCDDGYAQEAKLPSSNYCANCGARLNEPKKKGGAE